MSFLSDLLGTAYKEGMTEEDISKALEASHNKEVAALKVSLSKANSEAAGYKRKLEEAKESLKSKQTEEEAAAAARKEEFDRMQEENKQLKRTNAISDWTMKLMTSGYTGDLASKTAEAMVDGDMDTVLSNQAAFLESQKAQIKADLMRGTMRPGSGAGSAGADYSKKLEEARAAGNVAEEAYYIRLQAEAAAQND